MSLYDDFEPLKQKSNDQVAGWSSSMKLFQSQMQLKKAAQMQPKRDSFKKSNISLAPVIDLKGQKNDDEPPVKFQSLAPFTPRDNNRFASPIINNNSNVYKDMEWCFQGVEYDPMWPNDYEKAARDLKDIRDKEREREDDDRRRRRDERIRRDATDRRRGSDSEDDENVEKTPTASERKGGAAIAPPPSLQESSIPPNLAVTDPKQYGASVAAKIMAKYGFREGQGLGKKEQGMSQALQVEKTSKRGGRIIHEKDIMPPPAFNNMPPPLGEITPPGESVSSPTYFVMPPPPVPVNPAPAAEPSITEIMKSPSKVVLLRNMVGPGEVDGDLEPEVKDECNTKYGDVVKVIIHELPNAPDDEGVRIFVEFKRIESAIKAVVDLNGRFFGGRQVKAGFYKCEKFYNLELLD